MITTTMTDADIDDNDNHNDNKDTYGDSASAIQWLARLTMNPLSRVRFRAKAQLSQLFIFPNGLVDKRVSRAT